MKTTVSVPIDVGLILAEEVLAFMKGAKFAEKVELSVADALNDRYVTPVRLALEDDANWESDREFILGLFWEMGRRAASTAAATNNGVVTEEIATNVAKNYEQEVREDPGTRCKWCA